jgi:glycosyltransferase involved in cell wall biosynthesis
MTGGCHYSFGCDGFKNECGSCPQLNSTDNNDHTRATWLRKKQYLAETPIFFVAPTSWGIDRLKQSSLFRCNRVELIPYPLDLKIFRPFDRRIARDLSQLPFDRGVLFFGATYLEDLRKGMKQLIESLRILAELVDADRSFKRDDIFLLIAGLNGKEFMKDLPFPARYAGHFNDELTLSLAYQAADVFLCPSIEEAGPMMIPEAMLCGTPVVAFNTGGAPDLIETKRNGYLAKLADPQDFAHGIFELLKSESLPAMRVAAHESAARAHAPSIVVRRHIELYRSLYG